uniref:Uncharacterized protein n=1 Tax=Knipowitschia caucasica TaxID=637954 RepID=A0AAV2LF05_KNICA
MLLPGRSQMSCGKTNLKREIMEEVKAQMKGLSREIVTELRQFQAPPMHNQPTSPWTNPRRTPYNDRDERGVAKTLVEVKKGRLPVRVCNPHPYSVTINRFERLGRLFSVEAGDVHGVDDLSLSLVEDGVVEVALVNFAEAQMNVERPPGVVDLSERADLSEPQQEQLRALLAKWGKVFAQHEEDFGRANIVQHRIPTGNADPVREREHHEAELPQEAEDALPSRGPWHRKRRIVPG